MKLPVSLKTENVEIFSPAAFIWLFGRYLYGRKTFLALDFRFEFSVLGLCVIWISAAHSVRLFN